MPCCTWLCRWLPLTHRILVIQQSKEHAIGAVESRFWRICCVSDLALWAFLPRTGRQAHGRDTGFRRQSMHKNLRLWTHTLPDT